MSVDKGNARKALSKKKIVVQAKLVDAPKMKTKTYKAKMVDKPKNQYDLRMVETPKFRMSVKQDTFPRLLNGSKFNGFNTTSVEKKELADIERKASSYAKNYFKNNSQ